MTPRPVEKVTALPRGEFTRSDQLTVTVGVLSAPVSGISIFAAGAVNAKLALLMVSAWVAVAPAAVAVIVSLPVLVAVTVAMI
jgi:hypothetical protein